MEPIKKISITSTFAVVIMIIAFILKSPTLAILTTVLCGYVLYLNIITKDQKWRDFHLVVWSFNTVMWIVNSFIWIF
jgi:hypothetical protein